MRKLEYEEFIEVYEDYLEEGMTDFEKERAYFWYILGRQSVRL